MTRSCWDSLLILEEWILLLMNIQEFAVLILKGVRNREKMLCPKYLHGLKEHAPLEHLPRNIVLLFQLQLHIPLVWQHLYLQRITWVLVLRIWLYALLWTRKSWWKQLLVSARYNTEIRTYCYVGTNTKRVVSQTSEASTQSKLQTVSCVDVSKMTEGDYIKNITPFCIEQIKDYSKMIKFYIGVPSFQLLMVCFQFMSSAASNLSYGDYTKVTKRKLHKLSLFNEFS